MVDFDIFFDWLIIRVINFVGINIVIWIFLNFVYLNEMFWIEGVDIENVSEILIMNFVGEYIVFFLNKMDFDSFMRLSFNMLNLMEGVYFIRIEMKNGIFCNNKLIVMDLKN